MQYKAERALKRLNVSRCPNLAGHFACYMVTIVFEDAPLDSPQWKEEMVQRLRDGYKKITDAIKADVEWIKDL